MSARTILLLLAATAPLVYVALNIVDHVPPEAVTTMRMNSIGRRALEYAQATGRWPASSAELPSGVGTHSRLQDGWHRDITFDISASGFVTLRSLGRDGRVGGSGEDADIVRSFPLRDAQGNLTTEQAIWKAVVHGQ